MAYSSTASAPGKLILFGEHAVVYGATAVAGALSDLRASSTVVSYQHRHEVKTCCRFGLDGVSSFNHAWRLLSRSNVQTTTEERTISITVPDLAALSSGVAASDVQSSTYSWPLDQLRSALAHLLESARAGAIATPSESSAAIRPNAEIIAALDDLVSECPDSQARKAHSPVLFLSAGILFDHLFPGDGATASGSSTGACAAPVTSSPARFPGLRIIVHPPTLPVAAGLGSSAAFSVSTAGALLDLRAQLNGCPRGLCGTSERDGASSSSASYSSSSEACEQHWSHAATNRLTLVNEWAYCCEMLFHGQPSGLDNTVAT